MTKIDVLEEEQPGGRVWGQRATLQLVGTALDPGGQPAEVVLAPGPRSPAGSARAAVHQPEGRGRGEQPPVPGCGEGRGKMTLCSPGQDTNSSTQVFASPVYVRLTTLLPLGAVNPPTHTTRLEELVPRAQNPLVMPRVSPSPAWQSRSGACKPTASISEKPRVRLALLLSFTPRNTARHSSCGPLPPHTEPPALDTPSNVQTWVIQCHCLIKGVLSPAVPRHETRMPQAGTGTAHRDLRVPPS